MIGSLLLGGAIADRAPRHRVMLAAEALQAVAQGIAAVLLLTGQAHVWQLAAVAAAGGVGFGFYYPAAQGLLPQTVQASQLAQANALFRTGRNAASIGGAALGGVLTGLAGPGWALAADAATFAAAAALRTGMRFHRLPPAQATSTFRDLRDGWREFSSRRWLWAVVAQFTIVHRNLRRRHAGARAADGARPARRRAKLGPHHRRLRRRRRGRGPRHDEVPPRSPPRRQHAVHPGLFAAAVRARGAAARSAGSRRGPGSRGQPGSVHRLLGDHAAAGDTARQAIPHRVLRRARRHRPDPGRDRASPGRPPLPSALPPSSPSPAPSWPRCRCWSC